MRKDEFISYMSDPARLDERVLQPLADLLGDFPYFQTAHLLYLKVLYDQGHVRFDTQLKRSSFFVADRRRLYRLLHETPEKETRREVAGEEKVQKAPVHTEDRTTSKKLSEKEPRKEEAQEEKAPATATAATRSKEELMAEIRRRLQEIGKGSPEPSAGKKQREGSGSTGIQKTAKSTERGPMEEEKVNAGREAKNVKEPEKPGSEREEILELDPEGEEAMMPVVESPASSGGTDTKEEDEDLLEIDLEEKKREEQRRPETLKKKKVRRDPAAALAFSDWLSYLEREEESRREEERRKPQDEIIDRFLASQPRIVPREEEETSQVEQIVRESAAEKGLFTETLAGIYLKQGYYSKAIQIYEKLSLKYPEKSSYFAARIEEVKRILRDQSKKQ